MRCHSRAIGLSRSIEDLAQEWLDSDCGLDLSLGRSYGSRLAMRTAARGSAALSLLT